MESTVSVLLLLAAAAGIVQAADKPNFIFINVDDLGYGDIGPFGSKLNRTPHLDQMAHEGRKLTCFYAAPICSPSRASLMTGCYPPAAARSAKSPTPNRSSVTTACFEPTWQRHRNSVPLNERKPGGFCLA